jgi:MULE transposase domain
MAALFPEIMGVDVTEQTNNEKRPLLVLGGLTGDNRTFTSCHAFLPSQQRWVFDWFFITALPYLFPVNVLQRNEVMFTDGDPKEYCAFAEAAANQYFPNSRHHLCVWHLLDGGIRRHHLYPRGHNMMRKLYFDKASCC